MRFTGVTPHIYGKRKSRLNRKMGHITIVNKNIDDAIEMSKEIKKIIKVDVPISSSEIRNCNFKYLPKEIEKEIKEFYGQNCKNKRIA